MRGDAAGRGRRGVGGHDARVQRPDPGSRVRGGAARGVERVAYFSNFSDQRLYRRPVDGSEGPTAITPEIAVRYADATVDDARGRMICVAEDHRRAGTEAENLLAAVPTGGGEPAPVHRGFDFYASPRLSPDGHRLAWVCWNHPNLPWDATELWVADVAADGALSAPRRIAGGTAGDVSVIQPAWGPDGTLYCVSDASGWWNLHRWNGGRLVPVLPMEAEFGLPPWLFGMSRYAVLDADRLVAHYGNADGSRLGVIDVAAERLRGIATPFTTFGSFAGRRAGTAGVRRRGRGDGRRPRRDRPGERRVRNAAPGRGAEARRFVRVARRVPSPSERGRTHRARLLLRAAKPRVPRPRGRAAAAAHVHPRRSDRRRRPRVQARDSVLDDARVRRRRRGLRRVDGVRDRLPAPPARRLGHRRSRGLRGGGGSSRRARGTSIRPASRFAAAPPAATPRCARSRSAACSRRGASHYGVSDAAALARDTHKFESRYSTRSSVPGPSAPICTKSARRFTPSTASRAPSSSCKARGRRRASRPDRAHGRRPAEEGSPGRLPDVRG